MEIYYKQLNKLNLKCCYYLKYKQNRTSGDFRKMLFNQAQFLMSTPDLKTAPADLGNEIAFVGRSNAGKSSLLNALCNQKSLAITSKTPGRTRHLVFFECPDQTRLVDLPGYGFAKTSKDMKRQWQSLLFNYLEKRQSLRGLVLISDARHPLKESDLQLIELADDLQLPIYLFFSKSDKMSNNDRFKQNKLINEKLKPYRLINYAFGSSTNRTGLDEVKQWASLLIR